MLNKEFFDWLNGRGSNWSETVSEGEARPNVNPYDSIETVLSLYQLGRSCHNNIVIVPIEWNGGVIVSGSSEMGHVKGIKL